MSFQHCLDVWSSLAWPLVLISVFLTLLLSDSDWCWQLCYGIILSELLPCLSFWGLIWWGIMQLTYMFVTDTLEVQLICVCLKPKRMRLINVSVCQAHSPRRQRGSPSGCLCVRVQSSPHTYNVKLSRHLLRAKAVGDLAGVAAAVLLPQVTDGQPCQAPCPAGVWGQWPTIFQPAHGGAGVTSCYAGELYTLACVHFPCLETVQDGWWGLVGVWKGSDEVRVLSKQRKIWQRVGVNW